MQDYIDAGQLEPLNDLYAEQGWDEVFLEQLREQISVAGRSTPSRSTSNGRTSSGPARRWTVKHLLETVMIADFGPDGWSALWKAGGDWKGPEVTKALQDFQKVLS